MQGCVRPACRSAIAIVCASYLVETPVMSQSFDSPRRGRLWPTCSLLGIAGFVLLTLCARFNPTEAQQGTLKKKKIDPVVPARETPASKQKAKAEAVASVNSGN